MFFSTLICAADRNDVFHIVYTGQKADFDRIKNEINNLKMRDSDGKTLLIAAIEGMIDFKKKNSGTTALHLAAFNNDMASAEMLLKKGADPFIWNEDGMTPYKIAVTHHNNVTARVIYEFLSKKKVKLNSSSPSGYILENYIPIIEYLLKKGIEPDAADYSGKSAIHYAAESGVLEAVELLIDFKANVNLIDKNTGKSALIISTEKGYVDITEFLLSSNAEVNISYHIKADSSTNQNDAGNNSQYLAVPGEYNFKIVVSSSGVENPGDDNRGFYKVYVDKVEAGRTQIGLDSQKKVLTLKLSENKHLISLVKYELDKKNNKYMKVNNIYQPKPDYCYVDTVSDKIIFVEVVHMPRNVSSSYNIRFLRADEA